MKKFMGLLTIVCLSLLSSAAVHYATGINPSIPFAGFVALGIAGQYFNISLPCLLFSGFITQGSEFNGKENEEIILRPIFTGVLPTQMGIRVILTVKSSLKITLFGKLTKIMKAYADGFQGGSSSPQKQKKFILEEFKAEAEYSKQDYKDTILENITNTGGVKQNEITGTKVHQAEVRVFQNALLQDIFRVFWLGDLTKKTVASGVSDDSDVDEDYNVLDGIWKAVKDASSILPNGDSSGLAADEQIKRIVIANGTVAQVSTTTLTGSSGTANLTINSVDYLATFNTSLTITNTDFITTHAADLLAVGIVVTSSVADLIFTADVAGTPFANTAIANVSGNLAGSIAATTGNTAAVALGTDEAQATFRLVVTGAPKVMKVLPKATTRLYVTDTMEENYTDTLEDDGTEAAHFKVIDGVERHTFRGIPIILMGIDEFLEADFLEPFPHRALWTIPDNLVLVLNGRGDLASTKFWFNEDENKNRQRSQFEFGADFVEPEWMTAAY